MQRQWFYLDAANQAQGPVSPDEIRRIVARGHVYVWTEGMPSWTPGGLVGNFHQYRCQPAAHPLQPAKPGPSAPIAQTTGVTRRSRPIPVGLSVRAGAPITGKTRPIAARTTSGPLSKRHTASLPTRTARKGPLGSRQLPALRYEGAEQPIAETVRVQPRTTRQVGDVVLPEVSSHSTPIVPSHPHAFAPGPRSGANAHVPAHAGPTAEPAPTTRFPEPRTLAWLERPDGTRIPVLETDNASRALTIGRAGSTQDAAIVVRDGSSAWIEDIGSPDGVYLNGCLILQPARLNDRDVIGFPQSEYVFRLQR